MGGDEKKKKKMTKEGRRLNKGREVNAETIAKLRRPGGGRVSEDCLSKREKLLSDGICVAGTVRTKKKKRQWYRLQNVEPIPHPEHDSSRSRSRPV